MKTIIALRDTKEFNKGEIRRVDDKTANMMVGLVWGYISKSEWKKSKSVRSAEVSEQQKKPNPKMMDGKPSEEPFVKTRKKTNKMEG